jgi:hypothetical protein
MEMGESVARQQDSSVANYRYVSTTRDTMRYRPAVALDLAYPR